MRRIDISGQKFGRLTVLGRAEGQCRWLCKCQCGNPTVTRSNNLRSGGTRSCGCLQREVARLVGMTTFDANRGTKFVHGHSAKRSRTYQSWRMMRQRCNNPKADNYYYYGGRGITVCTRWDSFENFLADMGERPDGLTLDRYPDFNGNYEAGNCRWVTSKQQAANRR